jgi:hypothetical protein
MLAASDTSTFGESVAIAAILTVVESFAVADSSALNTGSGVYITIGTLAINTLPTGSVGMTTALTGWLTINTLPTATLDMETI